MPETTTAKQQWSSTAGPRQTKQVNDALKKLQWHGKTIKEITDRGEHCYIPMVTGVVSPACVQAQVQIGNAVGWTVTKDNFKQIIAACEAAIKVIPFQVLDKRTTPEQQAEEAKKRAAWQEEKAIKDAAFDIEYRKHLAELEKRYPWAKSPDSGLSPHARAAANMRTELAKAFPGIKFTVKSKSFSGGDSIDVDWEMGPTEKEVKEITSKYEDGHFDGMQDMYIHDASAFKKAVGRVLGDIKYCSEHRDYGIGIYSKMRDIILSHYNLPPVLSAEWPGDTDWHDIDCQGRTCWELVRSALRATSFPPGAVIDGLTDNPNGNGLDRFLVTYKAPEKPAPVAGGSGAAHVEKHHHTKKDFDMWLVILDNRVERDEFDKIRDKCKRAGGWYSRQWGKTPGGFAFDTEAAANEFAATL